MTQKINLVFMGGFTYPRGMAATKRIQNLINALKELPDVKTQVIIQRQFKQDNYLSGVYDGTHYQIIAEDLIGTKMLVALPMLYYKTIIALKKAYQPGYKNVIYFYGPLFIDSIVPLNFAKKLDYKIVFDVIEDFGLTKNASSTFYQYARMKLSNWFSSRIKKLSSGIIVISSYLDEKIKVLTHDKVPIHYMPISVDMTLFPKKPDRNKSIKTLFYAGSFGKKDGITILLEAFDKLAESHDDIRLVLTGHGDNNAMKEFFDRVERSSYKDRIEFKGYLNEEDYYALLNDADIPCMTRDDLAFAHAGFPFKLGEFLATGRPVIASRVSDVERFLIDKHNAMLVKAGSSEEIHKAAEFLFANPDSANAIGEEGREVANSFFEHKQQGKDLLAFIESLSITDDEIEGKLG